MSSTGDVVLLIVSLQFDASASSQGVYLRSIDCDETTHRGNCIFSIGEMEVLELRWGLEKICGRLFKMMADGVLELDV